MHNTLALRSLTVALCFCSSVAAQTVRFTVTSDSRQSFGYASVLEAISTVGGGPGDFTITTGDMDPIQTARDRIAAAFGSEFQWYPVIGNHEKDRDGDVAYLRRYYRDTLQGHVNPGPDGSQETTYSFDAGPVHIVVVNVYWGGSTNEDADKQLDGDVVPALREWVEADLAASSLPWKLLFLHEPAYPQPDAQWGDQRHEGDSLNKYPENRDAFWQVLENNGATACFVGHTHNYSRYRPEGSRVWQLDSAQARGPWDERGDHDTFFVVIADENKIAVEVYRRFDCTRFLLLETIDLAIVNDLPNAERPSCSNWFFSSLIGSPLCSVGTLMVVPGILAALMGAKFRVRRRAFGPRE